MFRFSVKAESPITRATKIIECMQQLSTLQIYGAVLDGEIIPRDLTITAPQNGTEIRLEINLLPAEDINARAGIKVLNITIPGPIKAISEAFNTTTPNLNSPYWQLLEKNVIPFLRLPNGLPVSPMPGLSRLKRFALIELPEERRPQPGRPPVDAAISVTIQTLDNARSNLFRAQRANKPFEYELQRVESYQRKLANLQKLHAIEQVIFQKLFPNLAEPLEENNDHLPIENLAIIVDKTNYLPIIPSPSSQDRQDWSDLNPADFLNHLLWDQIGQLKPKFKIASERSFWRTLARLRELGLRTLPAKQDSRVRLFYHPDLDRILTNTAAFDSINHKNISQAGTSENANSFNLLAREGVKGTTPFDSSLAKSILKTLENIHVSQQLLLTAINKIAIQLDYLTKPNPTKQRRQPDKLQNKSHKLPTHKKHKKKPRK
ncbi:MAG: hypothetical protein AB1489_37875 [Acidobacteriota bacterium]